MPNTKNPTRLPVGSMKPFADIMSQVAQGKRGFTHADLMKAMPAINAVQSFIDKPDPYRGVTIVTDTSGSMV